MTDANVKRTRPTFAPVRSRPAKAIGVPMTALDMEVSTEVVTSIRQRAASGRKARQLLEEGYSVHVLAEALGISSTTLLAWADGTQAVPPIALAIIEAALSHYFEGSGDDQSLTDLIKRYCGVVEFRTEA